MATRGSLARMEPANTQPAWPPEVSADASTAELEGGHAAKSKGSCQVPGCRNPERTPSHSHRWRTCEEHLRAAEVQLGGPNDGMSRHCQKCVKYHPVLSFKGLQRTCKAQLDIHNARRRRAYAAASKKALRVGAMTAAATRPASAAAAPRRKRKPVSALVSAPRPAPAVTVDAFGAALGNSLGALLLPALMAMSQLQRAPPIPPLLPPPPAPPPLLQAFGALSSLVGDSQDQLRACLSGLLQHALQPPQPPMQAQVNMDLVRMLLSAQQQQPQATPPAAGGAGALPLAWRTG